MKEKIASIGAVVSAGFASICCIGPLVLVGLGLGGAGLAAGLAKYRPFFLAITAVFLGVAFYSTYRKREVACADGSCELRYGSKTMKGFLWVVAAAALGTATFPSWSGLILRSQPVAVSTDAGTVRLVVTGMTCAACAAGIEKSLMKVPGVESASVSLENEEAVIMARPGQAQTEALIEAVRKTGNYDAKIKS
ncbi:MAG: cation transporter [Elusimicrobia bacterium]|nr:cation transporter [Elusimicrobiota bacterium]